MVEKDMEKIVIIPSVILIFIVLLPNTKEMIAIYTISAMTSNKEVQEFAKEAIKFPKNALEGANKLLERWINEKSKENN